MPQLTPRQHNIEQIKRLCSMYGLQPQRSRGQNFLIDPRSLEAMVAAAAIKPNETIVEIGPGFGMLTESLLERAGRVICIELDTVLAGYIQARYGQHVHMTLLQQNALDFEPSQHISGPYSVVANLPYSISGHFFKTYLGFAQPPERIVVLLQKEVAQRISAKPGEHSLLSIQAQLHAEVSFVTHVTRECFWPVPEVQSAIVALRGIKNIDQVSKFLAPLTYKEFWRIARIGFSARRKQLPHNLAAGLRVEKKLIQDIFDELRIPVISRAQELSIDQWVDLAKKLKIFFN